MIYPTIRHAQNLPDHPAIIDGEAVITYAALEQRVQSSARRLVALGVRPGGRVVVAGANSLAWVILAHAIPRVGAVLAPVNPRLPTADGLPYLERLAPALIVRDDLAFRTLPPAGWSGCPVVAFTEMTPEADGDAVVPHDEQIAFEDLHTIIPTSGSSGPPKGVCLTLQNHLASALANALNLGIDPQDHWLANLPFHHVGGLAVILRAAFYGTTVVLPSAADVPAMLEVIERHHVTQLSLVGTMLTRLLDACGLRPLPRTLRSILVGGGPVDTALLQEARARGWPVLPTYGMTETASQVATLSPRAADEKLDTVGPPLAMCEIEIRDDDGHALPPGHEGIICVSGPMVAQGYWIDPGRTEPIARDGWFATNDVGLLDNDGYLIVRGRRDNVIITGGEKVLAEEVEAVLLQAPGVMQAAVLGVDDREWGQKVVALVVMAPDAAFDAGALRAHCAGHLGPYKVPKTITRVDQLPLTATGKIDRRQLASTDNPQHP